MKVLVVIGMRNDFIDGSLGTPDCLGTQEGRNLPVKHCIPARPAGNFPTR